MKKLYYAFGVVILLTCTTLSGYAQSSSATSSDKYSAVLGKTKSNLLSLKTENDAHSPKPTIYPNPVKDVLNVKSVSPNANLEIISILGKSMIRYAKKTSIEVSSLPTGIYYLKVEDQGVVNMLRFIKQ